MSKTVPLISSYNFRFSELSRKAHLIIFRHFVLNGQQGRPLLIFYFNKSIIFMFDNIPPLILAVAVSDLGIADEHKSMSYELRCMDCFPGHENVANSVCPS